MRAHTHTHSMQLLLLLDGPDNVAMSFTNVDADVDEFGQDRVEPNFTWSLSLINAVQATELPRIVCKPLKEMSDVSKGAPLVDMAEVHGEEAERMILQCPDLQVTHLHA